MFAFELPLQSQDLLPVKFDLFHYRAPAWNHFWLESNDNHRGKQISSVILANLINRGGKGIVKVILQKENEEAIKLMKTIGGSVISAIDLKINLLQPPKITFDSSFREKERPESLLKILGKIGLPEWATSPYSLSGRTQTKEFLDLSAEEKHLILDALSDYIPSSAHIASVAKVIAAASKIEEENRLTEIILSAYKANSINLTYEDLKTAAKQHEENEILERLIWLEQNKLVFNQLFNTQVLQQAAGHTLFIGNKYNPKLSDALAAYMSEQFFNDLSHARDCIRIFWFDQFLSNRTFTSNSEISPCLERLRTSRKNGIAVIVSESEFKPLSGAIDSGTLPAIISNMQTKVFGSMTKDATFAKDMFGLDSFASIQCLSYDLGVKYLSKEEKSGLKESELPYYKIANLASIKEAKVAKAQALMLNQDESKITRPKSRFLNYIVDNKVGITSVEELMHSDLQYIDQEMKKLKLQKVILIIPKEIYEETLYQDYGYKNCKKFIEIKTMDQINKELDALYDNNRSMVHRVKPDKDKLYDGKILVVSNDLNLL